MCPYIYALEDSRIKLWRHYKHPAVWTTVKENTNMEPARKNMNL